MDYEFPDKFDGFILPNGEIVSIQDVDKMWKYLTSTTENTKQTEAALQSLIGECLNREYAEAAVGYLEKLLTIVDDPGRKAACFLELGQIGERSGNYESAEQNYARAFDLPQENNIVWYFLNNNLGYCLNHLGRHQEAKKYCRAAIRIYRSRHNAHKNLGIALQGLSKYVEAAKCYIRALKLCPEDPRGLEHLELLLAEHDEIVRKNPKLAAQIRTLRPRGSKRKPN